MKQQHLQRTTDFLTEELKCVSKREATDRVFFVSALEVSSIIYKKYTRLTELPSVARVLNGLSVDAVHPILLLYPPKTFMYIQILVSVFGP